jgi:hypothetical protein
MSKRVAKEINTVVNGFYPTIENHYMQFHDLDNSYQELVSRFAILESAQDYATQLDSKNISFHETGYNLCKRVIDSPKRNAAAASSSALAEGIVGQLSSNKYSRQYAASDASRKIGKAHLRKQEINNFSKIIFQIEEKYLENLKILNPSKNYNSSRDEYKLSSDGQKEEIKSAFKEDFFKGMKVWWEKMPTAGRILVIGLIISWIIGIINSGNN